MCVCVRACVRARAYVCAVCMRMRACVCLNDNTRARVDAWSFVYNTYVYLGTCSRVYVCLPMDMCMCVRICVCNDACVHNLHMSFITCVFIVHISTI